MSGRLDGKVAIVAGSSRGIGLATGRRLATEGASVVLNARHEEELAASVEKLRVDRDRFVHTMIVNTWAGVGLVGEGMRRGLADGGGAVVSISAIGSRRVSSQSARYTASKAALEALTKSFAQELGPLGVRVNAVAPGLVKTYVSRFLWEGGRGDAIAARMPLRRLGEPEDIAAAICFLLSDEASWITGVVLDVDGGALVNYPKDRDD